MYNAGYSNFRSKFRQTAKSEIKPDCCQVLFHDTKQKSEKENDYVRIEIYFECFFVYKFCCFLFHTN